MIIPPEVLRRLFYKNAYPKRLFWHYIRVRAFTDAGKGGTIVDRDELLKYVDPVLRFCPNRRRGKPLTDGVFCVKGQYGKSI